MLPRTSFVILAYLSKSSTYTCVSYNFLRLVKLTDQSGDCMQVDKAAPIPVPVQIRIPRLYSLDEFETPAS